MILSILQMRTQSRKDGVISWRFWLATWKAKFSPGSGDSHPNYVRVTTHFTTVLGGRAHHARFMDEVPEVHKELYGDRAQWWSASGFSPGFRFQLDHLPTVVCCKD